MRKSQQKLFGQLEQGKQTLLRVPLSFFAPKPSAHPKGTLGYLADQIGRTPEQLVAQFDRAGLPGLSPQHLISDDQKQALLDYLRNAHSTSSVLYEAPEPTESSVIVVQDIWTELIAQLARKPALLYELEPRKFEELVARLLEKQGCEVTLTKKTRDGGYDILGRVRSGVADTLFLAECKRYSPNRKVGVELVRGLYGVVEAERANYGVLITTSSFTKDARKETIHMGPRIQLREYDDLCAWLNLPRSEV